MLVLIGDFINDTTRLSRNKALAINYMHVSAYVNNLIANYWYADTMGIILRNFGICNFFRVSLLNYVLSVSNKRTKKKNSDDSSHGKYESTALNRRCIWKSKFLTISPFILVCIFIDHASICFGIHPK